MSKKVLILSGSPRRAGNSDLLSDRFMDGAVEAGNQVEKINVASRKSVIAEHVIIVRTMPEHAP